MIHRFRFPIELSVLFAFALPVCVLLTACSDDDPSKPQPPSHEFVWEVDTINPGSNFYGTAFYGTSSSNVYLAGGSWKMQGAMIPYRECWHWNGQRWAALDLSPYPGSRIAHIAGSDSTFVVLLDSDPGTLEYPCILAYDNGSLHTLPQPLGGGGNGCLRVVSRNEIYLGSTCGIQKYNGSTWEWLLDSTDVISGMLFTPTALYKHENGIIEFTSHRFSSNGKLEKYFFWRMTNGAFTVIDSFPVSETNMDLVRFGWNFVRMEDGVYSSSFGGIFKYQSGQWVKVHNEGGSILTGSVNNLYTTNFSDLRHYDGTTWKNLLPDITNVFPSIQIQQINGLFAIGQTVFLLTTCNNNLVVFRGKRAN